VAQQPYWGPGCLIVEVSRSHTIRRTIFCRDYSGRGIGPSQGPRLIICDIHKRQAPISPVGFEPATPVSERSQNPLLVRADTGIGTHKHTKVISQKLNLYRLHLEIMLSSNIAFTITLSKTLAVV